MARTSQDYSHQGASKGEQDTFEGVVLPGDPLHRGAEEGLSYYLKQVARIPLLSTDEERHITSQLDAARQRFCGVMLSFEPVLSVCIGAIKSATASRAHGAFFEFVRKIGKSGGIDPNLLRQSEEKLLEIEDLQRQSHCLYGLAVEAHGPLSPVPEAWGKVEQVKERIAGLANSLNLRFDRLQQFEPLVSEMVQVVSQYAKATMACSSDHEQKEIARARYEQALRSVYETPASMAQKLDALKHNRDEYNHLHKQLVSANLRLVVSVAKKYRGRGVPFDDLIQEGNRGLMRAADKFNCTLGLKFSSYATFWIKSVVQSAVVGGAGLVRLPKDHLESSHRIFKARNELIFELQREPRPEEIAERVSSSTRGHKFSAADIAAILRAYREPLSFDAPVHTTGEDVGDRLHLAPCLSSSAAQQRVERAIDGCDHDALRPALLEVMGRFLYEREQQVLCLRFGLSGEPPMRLADVGVKLGVSKERIRQVEEKAIRKLSSHFNRELLAKFFSN